MKMLSFKTKGLGRRIKVKTARGLIRKYDTQFVTLQETKKDFIDLEFYKRLWGDYVVSWEAIFENNTSGGFLCCWGNVVFSMSRVHKGNGFLAIEGNWRDNNEVITLVNVYSPWDLEGKRRFWKELLDYKNSSNVSRWCITRDFNSVRKRNERVGSSNNGGGNSGNKEIEEFNAFIEN